MQLSGRIDKIGERARGPDRKLECMLSFSTAPIDAYTGYTLHHVFLSSSVLCRFHDAVLDGRRVEFCTTRAST